MAHDRARHARHDHTAHIDGHQVGTATDTTYAKGRVGIGTGWNRVQFDDFSVVP